MRVSMATLPFHFLQPSAGNSARRSPTQVRTMALDIVKLHISLLSEFFTLSDMAVMLSSRSGTTHPPLLPPYSNLFTTGHFLVKILGEVQDAAHEVIGMDISNEVASGFKTLLESTKWRFVDLLVLAWLRGEQI